MCVRTLNKKEIGSTDAIMGHVYDKDHASMIESFVKELPSLRKAIGVSQTALGEKVGISRQSVSSIERNEVHMTWSIYVAAAAFLWKNLKNCDANTKQLIIAHRKYIYQFLEKDN